MSNDLARYHRQMLLPGFGEAGQQRLRDSTAMVVGCGALGSAAADLLARAGVGHLVVVDRDFVELSNLQRQLLFDEGDVAAGIPKAQAAKRRIAEINSGVRVTAIVDDVNHTSLEQYAESVDVFVDGLDNLETRYLVNDLAVSTGRPYVYGAAVGTNGMSLPILPHTGGGAEWETTPAGDLATPCLRCLFEEGLPPGTAPTCDTVGVLGSVVGMIANFQVAETLKILLGAYDRVSRRLLTVDLWSNEILQLGVDSAYEQGDCPCCKNRRFEYLDGRLGSSAAVLCGRDAVQLRHRQHADTLDLEAVACRLRAHGPVKANEFMLQAQVAEGDHSYELTLFADGRAIVKGTDKPGTARSIYAKYIGS